MDGTIIGQGFFNANFVGLSNPNPGNAAVGQPNATVIQIPSNADWVMVRDYTQYGTAGNSGAYFNGTANAYTAVEWYWQRGMPAGTALVKYYSNGAASFNGDELLTGGFTIYDPSGQSSQFAGSLPLLGNPVATTASTNATRPVVSTASTAGLSVGSIVRMSNTAQTDVNGVDMVVGAVVVNTSFTLLTATNPLATAPGAVGGAGFYRIVNFNELFYPRKRFVVKITQAQNAQVSTSIPHGYVAGQALRFYIPAQSGMTQLNSNQANNFAYATVLSVVDDYNFVIDQNTLPYTAFTWPTIAQEPCQFPEVVPVGENTGDALTLNQPQVPTIAGQQIFNTQTGILSDATVNTGYLGMLLGTGGNGNILGTPIYGPAGAIEWSALNVATPDTLFWVAGKSTYGGL